MAKFGNKDQAVTANSTTTVESTQGAPIGTSDLVKNGGRGTSPVSTSTNSAFGNTSSGSRAGIDVNMFNNTTPGAFLTNLAVGIFGVSATEMANVASNTSSLEHPAHAGWVARRAGTGPVISITANGTPTAYNNNDVIVVKSPQAGGNASITFTTNSTGGGLTFTIANPGAGFLLRTIPTSNIFVTNSTGGTAAGNTTTTNFTVSVGGRAGRVHSEVLVAMGSISNDASTDNSQYPGT